MSSELRELVDEVSELGIPIGTRVWRVRKAGKGMPRVLLLPDFVGTSRIYDPVLNLQKDSMVAVSYALVAERSAMLDGLSRVLDHLGTQRLRLVGTGFGGRIAIEFASAFPERVTSVVTVGNPVLDLRLSAREIAKSDARFLLQKAVEARLAKVNGDKQKRAALFQLMGQTNTGLDAVITQSLLIYASVNPLPAFSPDQDLSIVKIDAEDPFPSLSSPEQFLHYATQQ